MGRQGGRGKEGQREKREGEGEIGSEGEKAKEGWGRRGEGGGEGRRGSWRRGREGEKEERGRREGEKEGGGKEAGGGREGRMKDREGPEGGPVSGAAYRAGVKKAAGGRSHQQQPQQPQRPPFALYPRPPFRRRCLRGCACSPPLHGHKPPQGAGRSVSGDPLPSSGLGERARTNESKSRWDLSGQRQGARGRRAREARRPFERVAAAYVAARKRPQSTVGAKEPPMRTRRTL